MMSMIFVFVFDLGFYLFKTLNLNQRMESIMVGMQNTVMENNYLPEASYLMYETMFKQLATDMNGSGNDVFIQGFNINYDHNADLDSFDSLKVQRSGSFQTEILRKRMDTPAYYGDVMVVQVQVGIVQPMWDFGGNGDHNAKNWDKQSEHLNILTYTYYVPCLQYQTVT